MRANEDYGGHRVIIVKGKYRCKKGTVSNASIFAIYVDLDYKGLRIVVEPTDILVLRDDGKLDKNEK